MWDGESRACGTSTKTKQPHAYFRFSDAFPACSRSKGVGRNQRDDGFTLIKILPIFIQRPNRSFFHTNVCLMPRARNGKHPEFENFTGAEFVITQTEFVIKFSVSRQPPRNSQIIYSNPSKKSFGNIYFFPPLPPHCRLPYNDWQTISAPRKHSTCSTRIGLFFKFRRKITHALAKPRTL